MNRGLRWLAAAVAAGGLLVASGQASVEHARESVASAPVPSLEPAATAALWRRITTQPRRHRRAADCRPLRAAFYAQTDWLRLATKLAATASPCAQYFISVPPIAGNKTTPRPDQAWRIRALGSQFHAMAEIHFATWSSWVATTGSSWHAAGVEARRRMAEAGYDVAGGDTWAVNEFPSTVRTGAGTARANAREFVRGLYEGDGTRPTRGTVFIVGVGQSSTDLSLYQTNLQNWLTDSAFWTDMAAYVSDWSQEVYGDFRRFAVPGTPQSQRRDYLNDYLQHELLLARAGPAPIAAARAYLESAFSPLANAAWQWDSGYGWTMVPADQMQAFVSAQTHALRYSGVAAGKPEDRWGFAWAPRNATGLSASDFAAQTGAILDRLAAATRDSADTLDPADPGSGACGPPGQNLFCGGDLVGATFTEAWKSFRTWTQPVLVFTTPPQTLTAGAPSAAMNLALQVITGAPQLATSPIAVTLTSSSPQGQFSFAPTGPWSATLALTIPAGGNTAGPFYYLDTRAGSPVLTAAAAGITNGTQTETVQPGPPARLTVAPGSATLATRTSRPFTATAEDSFGNPVSTSVTWAVEPSTLGTLTPRSGASTTFAAGSRGGSGTLTATAVGPAGALTGTARLTVSPGTIRVASIRYGIGKQTVLVTATVIDAASRRPVGAASISVVVRLNGRRYFSALMKTAPNGRAVYRLRSRPGCYRTTVTGLAAPGYRGDRTTPANRFCK